MDEYNRLTSDLRKKQTEVEAQERILEEKRSEVGLADLWWPVRWFTTCIRARRDWEGLAGCTPLMGVVGNSRSLGRSVPTVPLQQLLIVWAHAHVGGNQVWGCYVSPCFPLFLSPPSRDRSAC